MLQYAYHTAGQLGANLCSTLQCCTVWPCALATVCHAHSQTLSGCHMWGDSCSARVSHSPTTRVAWCNRLNDEARRLDPILVLPCLAPPYSCLFPQPQAFCSTLANKCAAAVKQQDKVHSVHYQHRNNTSWGRRGEVHERWDRAWRRMRDEWKNPKSRGGGRGGVVCGRGGV